MGLISAYGSGIVIDIGVSNLVDAVKHRVWLGSRRSWVDFKRLQRVGLGEGWAASNEGAVVYVGSLGTSVLRMATCRERRVARCISSLLMHLSLSLSLLPSRA